MTNKNDVIINDQQMEISNTLKINYSSRLIALQSFLVAIKNFLKVLFLVAFGQMAQWLRVYARSLEMAQQLRASVLT